MTIQLIVVQGRPSGRALRFPPGQYYFGRGAECHVRPNSDWVSRQHCQLRVGPGGALLRDLGSRNGTLVNGQLLAPEHALADGDQIQIGPVVFEARLERAPAAPAPEVEMIRPADQDPSAPEKPLDSTAHHPAVPPPPPEW